MTNEPYVTVTLYQRDAVDGRYAPGSSFERVGEFQGFSSARLQVRVNELQVEGKAALVLGPARRYNGKCRNCKKAHSALVDTVERRVTRHGRAVHVLIAAGIQLTDPRVLIDNGVELACECGRRVELRRVEGKVSHDVPCDARCTGATGTKCECQCGGANHGADHAH